MHRAILGCGQQVLELLRCMLGESDDGNIRNPEARCRASGKILALILPQNAPIGHAAGWYRLSRGHLLSPALHRFGPSPSLNPA